MWSVPAAAHPAVLQGGRGKGWRSFSGQKSITFRAEAITISISKISKILRMDSMGAPQTKPTNKMWALFVGGGSRISTKLFF